MEAVERVFTEGTDGVWDPPSPSPATGAPVALLTGTGDGAGVVTVCASDTLAPSPPPPLLLCTGLIRGSLVVFGISTMEDTFPRVSVTIGFGAAILAWVGAATFDEGEVAEVLALTEAGRALGLGAVVTDTRLPPVTVEVGAPMVFGTGPGEGLVTEVKVTIVFVLEVSRRLFVNVEVDPVP